MANGRGRFRRDPFFDCFVILSTVVFPPLAVLSVKGCNVDFCINLLLTLLGWLPGTIHAIFIIFAYPDEIFGVKKEELEAVDAMIAAEAGRQSIEGARERRYLFVPANVVYVEESRQVRKNCRDIKRLIL
ncbi:hypothetical protein BKA69DRAFT_497105 [Paraphysoderma sedebokerense]|nr:hypothetical protein BKA69DRAFT_497105 [Paraphysoderma sedebokerense]